MMATVVEFGCYFLLDDADLFNMIVFAKTSITFFLWMSTKKQWVSLLYPCSDVYCGEEGSTKLTDSI